MVCFVASMQLLDEQGQQTINFKQFAWCTSVTCKSDLADRLLLFYKLHLPPALPDSELDTADDLAVTDRGGLSPIASPMSGHCLNYFLLTSF